MAKSFINKHSAKCMLGPMSKEPKFVGNLFTWTVMKKKHFVLYTDAFENEDIEFLKEYGASSFHYLSESNFNILKSNFDTSRAKMKSTITHVDDLKFVGRKLRRFRNYLNRYKDFEICDEFKDLQDVKEMINTWSETSAEKYFRDFSGKNFYFFKQGWHKECDSIFVYDQDKLVSFGVASPVENDYSTYVIGKALCLQYSGLSEFTDIKLYEKLLNKYGSFNINLGQAKGKLASYKCKFPNTTIEVHYDGKIEV